MFEGDDPFQQLFRYYLVMQMPFYLSLFEIVEFVDGKHEAKGSVCENRKECTWEVECVLLGSSLATILFWFLVLEGNKLAGANKALASFILYLQSVGMG